MLGVGFTLDNPVTETLEASNPHDPNIGPRQTGDATEAAIRPFIDGCRQQSPRDEGSGISSPRWHDRTATVSAVLRISGLAATDLFDEVTKSERCLTRVIDTGPGAEARRHGHRRPPEVPKVAGQRTAIAAAGARLPHIPAYNPDLGAIGQAFAKLKALLRTEAAHTVPDLWVVVRNAFEAFHRREC